MKEPPAAKRILNSFTSKIEDFLTRGRGNYRLWRLAQQTLKYRQLDPSQAPVIFFNASTRITGMSLNASFAVLASMGLQLARIPVIHFACQAGMSRCVQGSDRDNPDREPPCRACVAQSRWLYANAPVVSFHYRQEPALANALSNLNVDQLSTFEYPLTLSASNSAAILPLGKLTLPSVRWVLRRCHLVDDTHTRLLFREFMLSAWQVAKEFISLIERTAPQAIVVFNGQFFPEAIVRWIGLQHSIRVITHEVGLQPFTAFFTPGDATAYPLDIPADFELNEKQNARLDAYLEKRLKGQFTMAGIRFWNSISRLDDSFLHRAARFQQIVPVFTNVIFDTSQPHSNAIFSDMFAWLDLTLDLIRKHPETLFVLRAHPDESRPGKESRESVRQWVERYQVERLPNVVFVDSNQPLSSYELIQRSKFVMIYNSTIGLEAAILGAAVLCAGRSRFTQLPTVFFPATQQEYLQLAEQFLSSEKIETPAEHQRNARRFLYYQLFRSSLPFEEYLEEEGKWPGFVRLRKFPWQKLLQESPTMRIVVDGIVAGKPFLLQDDELEG